MVSWNDIELARLHREELLREAAASRRARSASPSQGSSRLLEALSRVHQRLHDLEAARLEASA